MSLNHIYKDTYIFYLEKIYIMLNHVTIVLFFYSSFSAQILGKIYLNNLFWF
jgi:hypothetical protein